MTIRAIYENPENINRRFVDGPLYTEVYSLLNRNRRLCQDTTPSAPVMVVPSFEPQYILNHEKVKSLTSLVGQIYLENREDFIDIHSIQDLAKAIDEKIPSEHTILKDTLRVLYENPPNSQCQDREVLAFFNVDQVLYDRLHKFLKLRVDRNSNRQFNGQSSASPNIPELWDFLQQEERQKIMTYVRQLYLKNSDTLVKHAYAEKDLVQAIEDKISEIDFKHSKYLYGILKATLRAQYFYSADINRRLVDRTLYNKLSQFVKDRVIVRRPSSPSAPSMDSSTLPNISELWDFLHPEERQKIMTYVRQLYLKNSDTLVKHAYAEQDLVQAIENKISEIDFEHSKYLYRILRATLRAQYFYSADTDRWLVDKTLYNRLSDFVKDRVIIRRPSMGSAIGMDSSVGPALSQFERNSASSGTNSFIVPVAPRIVITQTDSGGPGRVVGSESSFHSESSGNGNMVTANLPAPPSYDSVVGILPNPPFLSTRNKSMERRHSDTPPPSYDQIVKGASCLGHEEHRGFRI